MKVEYEDVQKNLDKIVTKMIKNHDAVFVFRKKGKPFVMLSLEDFTKHDTTTYITSSKANRDMLLKAKEDIKNYQHHKLLNPNEKDNF